jgi:hypothetical protein
MVTVFRDQHVGKQSRTRQSPVDGPCRSRRLDDALASCAGELGPHMTNHLGACGDAFQLFGNVFAELAQRSAAIGAAVVCGKMSDHFPRKIFGQRLAHRARTALGSC